MRKPPWGRSPASAGGAGKHPHPRRPAAAQAADGGDANDDRRRAAPPPSGAPAVDAATADRCRPRGGDGGQAAARRHPPAAAGVASTRFPRAAGPARGPAQRRHAVPSTAPPQGVPVPPRLQPTAGMPPYPPTPSVAHHHRGAARVGGGGQARGAVPPAPTAATVPPPRSHPQKCRHRGGSGALRATRATRGRTWSAHRVRPDGTCPTVASVVVAATIAVAVAGVGTHPRPVRPRVTAVAAPPHTPRPTRGPAQLLRPAAGPPEVAGTTSDAGRALRGTRRAHRHHRCAPPFARLRAPLRQRPDREGRPSPPPRPHHPSLALFGPCAPRTDGRRRRRGGYAGQPNPTTACRDVGTHPTHRGNGGNGGSGSKPGGPREHPHRQANMHRPDTLSVGARHPVQPGVKVQLRAAPDSSSSSAVTLHGTADGGRFRTSTTATQRASRQGLRERPGTQSELPTCH